MCRTAMADVNIGDKQISKGDRVVMWYISGNRDESVIDKANEFIIDRRHRAITFHLAIESTGVGNRLGEMQLNILWEK